jgi:hypothetical protein
MSRPYGISFDTSIFPKSAEWSVDYPWLMERIGKGPIVDLGAKEHWFFAETLASLGFDVTTVDFAEWDKPRLSNHTHVSKRDVRDTGLPAGSFNTVIAHSLIEHVGLGHYGDEKDVQGDINCLKECLRIAKPRADVFVQIPYGAESKIISNSKGNPFYRIYNDSFWSILDSYGWYPCITTYFAHTPAGWMKVSKRLADSINQDEGLCKCIVNFNLCDDNDF